MPEDSKKNQEKRKNDPKEQRKPRNSRSQPGKVDRKVERTEEPRSAPKVTVPQKPPVYEDPGPEFYKNLKRETDEILKITEEENKYKKKEIQSNWSKYEMPIESYEEIEEHDVGADYEKLIQAPLSIGGHFQFKHEKSWDVNTGPSLYDKYFEINMDNLSLAVSTIPFYERNGIEQSLFTETDMLSMNNRATKYKQKYFNDKSYATAETEAFDKLNTSIKEIRSQVVNSENVDSEVNNKDLSNIEKDRSVEKDDINLDFKNLAMSDDIPSPIHSNKQIEEKVNKNKSIEKKPNFDNNVNLTTERQQQETTERNPEIDLPIQVKDIENILDPLQEIRKTTVSVAEKHCEAKETNDLLNTKIETAPKSIEIKPETQDDPVESKNPVIESPEDLEKWLDDFLDG